MNSVEIVEVKKGEILINGFIFIKEQELRNYTIWSCVKKNELNCKSSVKINIVDGKYILKEGPTKHNHINADVKYNPTGKRKREDALESPNKKAAFKWKEFSIHLPILPAFGVKIIEFIALDENKSCKLFIDGFYYTINEVTAGSCLWYCQMRDSKFNCKAKVTTAFGDDGSHKVSCPPTQHSHDGNAITKQLRSSLNNSAQKNSTINESSMVLSSSLISEADSSLGVNDASHISRDCKKPLREKAKIPHKPKPTDDTDDKSISLVKLNDQHREKLVLDDYYYTVKLIRKQTHYWYCVLRFTPIKCPGSVTTLLDNGRHILKHKPVPHIHDKSTISTGLWRFNSIKDLSSMSETNINTPAKRQKLNSPRRNSTSDIPQVSDSSVTVFANSTPKVSGVPLQPLPDENVIPKHSESIEEQQDDPENDSRTIPSSNSISEVEISKSVNESPDSAPDQTEQPEESGGDTNLLRPKKKNPSKNKPKRTPIEVKSMSLVKIGKNREKLLVDDFYYTLNCIRNRTYYWYCSLRCTSVKCPGSITTTLNDGTHVLKRNPMPHIHDKATVPLSVRRFHRKQEKKSSRKKTSRKSKSDISQEVAALSNTQESDKNPNGTQETNSVDESYHSFPDVLDPSPQTLNFPPPTIYEIEANILFGFRRQLRINQIFEECRKAYGLYAPTVNVIADYYKSFQNGNCFSKSDTSVLNQSQRDINLSCVKTEFHNDSFVSSEITFEPEAFTNTFTHIHNLP